MLECLDCRAWQRVYRQTVERVLQHGEFWGRACPVHS